MADPNYPDDPQYPPTEGTPYREQPAPEWTYDPGSALTEEPADYENSYSQNSPDQGYPAEAYGGDGYGSAEAEQQSEPQDPAQWSYDPGSALSEESQVYIPKNRQATPSPQQAQGHRQAQVPYLPPPQAFPAPGGTSRARAGQGSAGGRTPAKKVVAGRSAPKGHLKRKPLPKYGGGGISFGTVVLFVVAIGLLGAVAAVMIPRDLSGVAGYPPGAVSGAVARNLLTEVQKAMIDRNTELTFSEAEVNQYLAARLKGKQSGFLGSLVNYRGTCIDFSPGKAVIVVERSAFGLPLTMGVELVTEGDRTQMIYKPVAWYIGQIKLGDRTLKPMVDLFLRLRNGLGDEYLALQQMGGVQLEDDKIIIDAKL